MCSPSGTALRHMQSAVKIPLRSLVSVLAAHPSRNEMISGTTYGGEVQVIAPYQAKDMQAVNK